MIRRNGEYAGAVLESTLLRTAGFRHGFSTRAIDFSPRGAALAVESVALTLRFDPAKLYGVHQAHGARAVVARGDPAAVRREEADALVANEPGAAIGVRVADCAPVLLADPERGGVIAVHAGWRGVEAGVVRRALELARELGVRPTLAAIGPCIGACCFEVGADVAERIARASDPSAIVRRAGEKAFVDLRRAVRAQLAGVRAVEDVPGCTRCEPERFFSHRREGEAAGRHMAVIVAR